MALTTNSKTCVRCGQELAAGRRDSTRTVHARCEVSPELADDLLELKRRFPRVSHRRLAADFGLSVQGVRFAISEAMMARGQIVPERGR